MEVRLEEGSASNRSDLSREPVDAADDVDRRKLRLRSNVERSDLLLSHERKDATDGVLSIQFA